MAHVFISYVRADALDIDRLAKRLIESGVRVWLDRKAIEPGARWEDAITKAIRGGNFFMACFSKEYNHRSRNYMNAELAIAIDDRRRIEASHG